MMQGRPDGSALLFCEYKRIFLAINNDVIAFLEFSFKDFLR